MNVIIEMIIITSITTVQFIKKKHDRKQTTGTQQIDLCHDLY